MKQRQRQNAISAVGHFISWLTELGVNLFAVFIVFLVKESEYNENLEALFSFFYPCVNLVVFPFVQVLGSDLLREEAKNILACWSGLCFY